MFLPVLLSACGGADEPASPKQAAATQASAAGAGVRASTGPDTVTAEQFMRWAQLTYPDLFPDSPPILTVPHEGRNYSVRAYINGNYIGLSEGRIYGLGPFTQGTLTDFGAVADLAGTVCQTLGCGATGPDSGAVDTRASVLPPSPAAITARVVQGGTLGSAWAAFSGTLAGDPTALAGRQVYVIVEDPSSLFQPQATLSVQPAGNRWDYRLQLQPRPLATAGHFTGTVRVFACLDSTCSTRLAGTPVAIPYDVTVASAFSVNTRQLVLSVPYGTVPAPQAITLTQAPFIQQVSYWNAAYTDDTPNGARLSSYAIASPMGYVPAVAGTTTLTLRFQPAPPGTYRGRISLLAMDVISTDGQRIPEVRQDIEVVYTVTPAGDNLAVMDPASVALTVRQGTPTQDNRLVRIARLNGRDTLALQAVEYLDHPATETDAALLSSWLQPRYQRNDFGPDMLWVEAPACQNVTVAGATSSRCLQAGVYTARVRLRLTVQQDPTRPEIPASTRELSLPVSLTVTP